MQSLLCPDHAESQYLTYEGNKIAKEIVLQPNYRHLTLWHFLFIVKFLSYFLTLSPKLYPNISHLNLTLFRIIVLIKVYPNWSPFQHVFYHHFIGCAMREREKERASIMWGIYFIYIIINDTSFKHLKHFFLFINDALSPQMIGL